MIAICFDTNRMRLKFWWLIRSESIRKSNRQIVNKENEIISYYENYSKYILYYEYLRVSIIRTELSKVKQIQFNVCFV